MNQTFNLSAGPHTRSPLNTRRIMGMVIFALLPTAVIGVITYGFHAFLVILVAVATAVATEFLFNLVCRKPVTVTDGSAIITGLLLALSLPPSVPLYIPFFGSLFAIGVVKCCFGGLGKNFINPALAGRCFLLLSFSSIVTTFEVDAVSTATPLAVLKAGGSVDILEMLIGTSNAVIGSSIIALIAGGIALYVLGIIQGSICVSVIVSFTAFMAVFGGKGLDPVFLLAHFCGGGMIMGALFMATDYTTSPASRPGQITYGCLIGFLGGAFRVFSNAEDSFSYAIIIANLFVPLIDMYVVTKPYGQRKKALQRLAGEQKTLKDRIPKPVAVIAVITLAAGFALSGVYTMTKETIEEQRRQAKIASYKTVCPEAENFVEDEAANRAIEALDGGVYGTDFRRAYINSAVIGQDAQGNPVGTVISVTSADGYDGTLTLSLGIREDGSVNAIAFTELHETPGMGMNCADPEFAGQFEGRQVDAFILNKDRNAATDEEINTVSGASTTSGAVVNAVNAGLDFYRNVMKGGQSDEK